MSEKFIPENTWEKYAERTENIGPRPSLVKAIIFVANRDEALDLGSGAMSDVKYLVSENFKHITAVDSKPLGVDIVKDFPPETVSYVISTFEDFDFAENKYDLINAQYSLPFNQQNTFDKVFKSTILSLRNGGIITGQFFGINDEWNTANNNMNFQTREEVEELLSDLEIIDFKEEEANRPTAKGDMKHWHIFHFIAKKV